MNHPEEVNDTMLMALADGELNPPEADRLRALIAADPALAESYALFAETRALMADAFPPEPVPDRLIRAVLDTPAGSGADVAAARPARARGQLIAFRRRSAPGNDGAADGPRRWLGAALAASLALAMIGGFWAGRGLAPVAMVAATPEAAAAALAATPTGGEITLPEGGGTARALASYQTDLGLCRLIGLDHSRAVVCRDQATGRWGTAISVAAADGETYLPASDLATGLIDRLLDDIGAGAAMDAAGEAAALSPPPAD